MKIRVEVTREDIDGAMRRHACACPIAMALKRFGLPRPWVLPWWVTPTVAFGTTNGPRALLPGAAAEAARNFDDTGAMEPFAFDLEVPSGDPAPGLPGRAE